MKLAFLRQERYLALMLDGEHIAEIYDKAIAEVDKEIADQQEMLKHLHT